MTKLIAPGVLLERDLRIPLSDGTRLAVNVFHPTDELPHPAILSVTPVTDLLRELAYQDGIPETGFVPIWWKHRIVRGHNRRFPMGEGFLADSLRHPLDDGSWTAKRPALERIEVPALVCASWSDHGLHTRGSIIGFERIGSKQKWLFTHGRKKWETFYSQDALDIQTRFFDRFLRGLDNGMDATPRVRLECRRAFYQAEIRTEATWPLTQGQPTPLYLSASPASLDSEPSRTEGIVAYSSTARWFNRRATFAHTFRQETELTGNMRLKLWVSALRPAISISSSRSTRSDATAAKYSSLATSRRS